MNEEIDQIGSFDYVKTVTTSFISELRVFDIENLLKNTYNLFMEIILKWNPISSQNAYGQHGKIRYMKKVAKATKDSYIIQAKTQYKGSPLSDNLSVYIRLYFKDKRVRDWDNWHKVSMDSLTWIVYIDDSQIKVATIQIMEQDKDNPRIEIIIDPI